MNLRIFKLSLTIYIASLILIVIQSESLEFIRQYHTFPTNAARPKFIVQPENLDVDQGSRAQLRCSGDASPPPMLFWYKEGHRQLMFAPTPPSTTPSTSSKREFPDWPQASALVATDYRSSSSPSSDISPAVNRLFSMPVNYDQLTTSNYGNNYFGNRIYVDNQGTLNFINVTHSDTGYYACALISSVGSVMAKAKLTVRQPSNIPSSASDYYNSAALHDTRTSNSVSKFDLLPPPVIKLGAANQTLPTNTSATLVCDVVSQVAYKVIWLFESQPLQEEPGRIVVLETGGLSINNLKISDSGIYTCVVTAANDQIMPLATPFEPLDASMLTSAPPTQQSTSHSTMLKVASPMNPNIQFYRMDTYAYPSSPGPAYLVSTNGNDAITIAWSPPAESGSLPIKEYVIEHFDTSQEHTGWKEIHRVKVKESLLIDGLSSDGSHFFVIRAANSHGTGPSSSIAGPMRTVAGEARYLAEQRRRAPTDYKKFDTPISTSMQEDRELIRERLKTISTNLLSVTAVSSSSIKLQWSTQENGNSSSETLVGLNPPLLGMPDVSDFVEGYSILYRAIGIGESLIKDPLLGMIWSPRSRMEMKSPTSLPLVTSYVEEEPIYREKRESSNYFDYSREYSEVRVVDHNTEHYTINGLQPFTLYQFFVTPYYKDIDGVPSNFLTGQTHEGKPGIAPPNLTIRPLNNTAVKLLWRPIPPPFANGILKGYMLRVNRGDILINNSIQSEQHILDPSEATKIMNLPLSSLSVAPFAAFPPDTPIHPNNLQDYIVIYDLTNLTYKSFYSIQVAGATGAGAGPWSEPENFIMDPKVLAQSKERTNDFEDVMSKSLISNVPQTYGKMMSSNSNIYLIVSISLIVVSIITILGYLLYRRNNQKVITWKKTISEHFTNKFYMHPTVDHRGSNSMQQNIYDHQQHLIYSGNPHMTQQIIPTQAIWANNNCINSSGTGSLSSHGGLIPVQSDPNIINGRKNNDQHLIMSRAEMNTRFAKNQLTNQPSIDSSRPLIGHNQAKQQSDYYSVINNMAEYEELDPQQRNNMHLVTNSDRHQTASSNSDTSCPSSVTRLLPNQNYNRDLLTKNLNDIQRHDMVLQQQVIYNDGGKQPFATMIANERMQSLVPLSPYATTNLMNNQVSMPQQMFQNSQTGLIDHSRQQNFVLHNGGITMDDSSKVLVNHHHQQVNGVSNPISVFRTLQRNPVHFQSRNQQFSQAHQPQVFIPGDNSFDRFQNQNLTSGPTTSVMANITTNPMNDIRSNVYEHVDYSDQAQQQKLQRLNSQVSSSSNSNNNGNNIISSSTSSGSMKSSSQQHSPDQQTNLNKLRRGSNATFESEAHDLHVFSSPHESTRVDSHSLVEGKPFFTSEDKMDEENHEDGERDQVDETTAFRRKSSQSDNQKARQLSKRKRQQQRNRLHNNNQNIG